MSFAKDVFSDITTYEDFLTKYETFKFEDDGFYVNGSRTPGLTSTIYGNVLSYYLEILRCIYNSAVAVELDGEIKMAVLRCAESPETKRNIYSAHIASLTVVDGMLKFPRINDWGNASGKSK